MNYEQLNWIRNVREDDLAQVALKLAAEDWNLFQVYARQLNLMPPAVNKPELTTPPKYTTKPVYAEGVHPEVMRECVRLYGEKQDKVAVVRHLRNVYSMDLKQSIDLMRDLVSYWTWQDRG